jgi:hypothetical protein
MSKDNYLFSLDDALLLISDNKLANIVPFMVGQHTAVHKNLGEWLGAGEGAIVHPLEQASCRARKGRIDS